MEEYGTIFGVNGSVVTVKDYMGYVMGATVAVGHEKLMGEVIRIDNDKTLIQVFENTTGLKPGEPVISLGEPLSVTLGPGLMGNIFDGIERPLETIEKESGVFISRGINVKSLDINRKWSVSFFAQNGDMVGPGNIIGATVETASVINKIMIPPHVSGELVMIKPDGEYTVEEIIACVKASDGVIHDITLAQKWPIRTPRPVNLRKSISEPLVTGQRIIDTMFPIAKGGTAAVPGGFGTGKTMTQHQLAKWSNADIIVYIGCGERGNEMTQVLEDFSGLNDPRTGNSLMDRTILIANTSNMPVAAREASIYTGITIAEYYRDMGYDVAIMADSTSRWAEALRELSGRLEEMPAEEGFPAYLASRLAGFYERAASVENLNGTKGSVTIIGAVSPQGGDFSEPVTQNTKRFVRTFWALDKSLAYARHFPAIQWLTSYSEYLNDLTPWYEKNVSEKFIEYRAWLIRTLNEEAELMEIVKLIGSDVLPDSQKLTLEISRVIRLGFVQQNAYHSFDTYVTFEKQMKMMAVIHYLYGKAKDLTDKGIPINTLLKENIFEEIISIKYNVSNDESEKIDGYYAKIDEFYEKIRSENL